MADQLRYRGKGPSQRTARDENVASSRKHYTRRERTTQCNIIDKSRDCKRVMADHVEGNVPPSELVAKDRVSRLVGNDKGNSSQKIIGEIQVHERIEFRKYPAGQNTAKIAIPELNGYNQAVFPVAADTVKARVAEARNVTLASVVAADVRCQSACKGTPSRLAFKFPLSVKRFQGKLLHCGRFRDSGCDTAKCWRPYQDEYREPKHEVGGHKKIVAREPLHPFFVCSRSKSKKKLKKRTFLVCTK